MERLLQRDGKGQIILPNVRKVMIPDPGYALYEADLAGADAQVVAWEAEDDDLKDAFRKGLDVHVKNAEDLWGSAFSSLKGHARDKKRQETKRSVHLTNYGGSDRTLAIAIGWPIHEATLFQRRWFGLHPGIKKNFQGRIQDNLQRTRTVWNKYGFRCVYFDRPDAVLPEALAWVPQSTVALTTYYGAFQLKQQLPFVEILLQVHDSLVFQIPLGKEPSPAVIKAALRVKTPYDDPLYIPWGLARSTKSWGEVEKI